MESGKPWRAAIISPLRHLAMVSYDVSPERVRPHVPSSFELETRANQRGEPRAFVSAVMFENREARQRVLPWLRSTYLQVNYRTYVRYQRQPGVWFFRIMVQSRLALVQRLIFRAPSYAAPMRLQYEWDARRQRYTRYRFDSAGMQHALHADIEGTDGRLEPGPLFESSDSLVTFLTFRPDGFFKDPRGPRVSRMTVWHEPMRPQAGILQAGTFDVLDRLGLVPLAEQWRPYTVLLQPSSDFFGQYPTRVI